MTASLFNNSNGSFGNVIDGIVYPQFIHFNRAPTSLDIYPAGTRIQDDSQNPPVQYYTTGAGVWNELPNSSFGVSSITGTANQVTASAATGAVTLSVPATFIGPGSIASTTTLTGGTGITATTGNITATNGNVALNTAGNKIIIATGSNASVGTSAAMSGTPGAVVVATTACSATAKVFYSRATAGGSLGNVSITAQDGTGFTLTSTANETSTFNWWIINA